MPVRTDLPNRVRKAFATLVEGSRSFYEEQRGNFEQMSERWHEGDRAADVSVWLDELEAAVEAIEGLDLPDDI